MHDSGGQGTKVIFVKANIRRRLWQVLGISVGGEWKM